MRKLAALITIALLVLLVACGGSSTTGGTPPPATQVKLNTTTASTLVGQTAQFTANIPVTWSIQEANGGTISAGLYQAPWQVGTFHVVAQSVADTTKSASATVSVSAKFAFLRQASTQSTPLWTVTPMLGTINPDQSFTENAINDSSGQPLQTSIYNIALSNDGAHAVFAMPSLTDSSAYYYTQNVYTAASDGSAITQLTSNQSGDGVYDEWPQFSPDSKHIVYEHEVGSPSDNYVGGYMQYVSSQIVIADTSGQNKQVVIQGAADTNGSTPYLVTMPSWSPDGSKIAFSIERWSPSLRKWYLGIAVTSLDGSGLTQLTGEENAKCAYGYDGWDFMPEFSNDGTKIGFMRECWETGGNNLYTLSMIVNADGTNARILEGAPYPGHLSCEPTAVADKMIVSTNSDYPGHGWFRLHNMDLNAGNDKILTGGQTYDGFSVWWIYYAAQSTAASRVTMIDPLQKRLWMRDSLRNHQH